ncbi:MAG: 16S rRNA (guanine(527)-N(7))-methyltransferase RsmG [Terracidiphilus sp.]
MKASGAFNLNELLIEAGLPPLDSSLSARFCDYLGLIVRWNQRINLTAIREEEGILRRHFVESIACAHALPAEIATLLDFGSGAGLPGIPIALCRPEIEVTLAESQNKKAAFLREAVRVLEVSAKVHGGRAELLNLRFDCVVLRAVDRMVHATQAGARLVASRGWLALLTTVADRENLQVAAGASFTWCRAIALPGGDHRILALGERMA